MRGAAIYDTVSAGVPEAMEAFDLARQRVRDLSDDDFRTLAAELAEREPITAAETEILAICLSEGLARFLRATPADPSEESE